MWPDGVVMMSLAFDEDLCLVECVEDFSVEQFVAELTVKTIIMAVLPG